MSPVFKAEHLFTVTPGQNVQFLCRVRVVLVVSKFGRALVTESSSRIMMVSVCYCWCCGFSCTHVHNLFSQFLPYDFVSACHRSILFLEHRFYISLL